ncbi:hypothetical protein SUDANB121_05194 [Nocardiopsis dassonvillei]|uniref:sensor histidine kinase n=1 Tax=Nocardiopsis dassonvillei TaxID=2014 RepID=UPI003F575AFA
MNTASTIGNPHTAEPHADEQSSTPVVRRILHDFLSRVGAAVGEPVSDARTAEELLRQAEAALHDGFASLRAREVVVDTTSLPRRTIAHDRADCGEIEPAVVQRVTGLLFEVGAEAVARLYAHHPEAAAMVALWLRALHESVGQRVTALIEGHDGGVHQPLRDLLETDQRRLARDVHDWIGSGLSMVDRNLELYEMYRGRGVSEAEERLQIARKGLRLLMDDTRKLVSALRPTRFEGDIRGRLERFAHHAIPGVEVQVHVRGEQERVPDHQREELFVIIRECLRNIDKHARARLARVDIAVSERVARIGIEDDGIGFDVEAARADRDGGHGLSSVVERARNMGGTAHVDSTPGQGTRVRIAIPLPGIPL